MGVVGPIEWAERSFARQPHERKSVDERFSGKDLMEGQRIATSGPKEYPDIDSRAHKPRVDMACLIGSDWTSASRRGTCREVGLIVTKVHL